MASATLVWDSEFELGIDIIDEQHRTLFDYFEKIESMINDSNVCHTELEYLVRGLIDYAIYHNSYEEKLMEDAGYPMLEPHHLVHEEFRRRVKGYEQQMEAGEDLIKIARRVRIDIGMWLVNHIKREDRHYVSHVKKHLAGGVKGMLSKLFS